MLKTQKLLFNYVSRSLFLAKKGDDPYFDRIVIRIMVWFYKKVSEFFTLGTYLGSKIVKTICFWRLMRLILLFSYRIDSG